MASEAKAAGRRRWLWIVGLLVLLIFVLGRQSQRAPVRQTTTAAVPETALPDTRPPVQRAFSDVVEQYRGKYKAAGDELLKSRVRTARATALNEALPALTVAGWQGRITALGTTGDGKAYVSIEIGPKLEVKTWNNALSDAGDQTLIPQGTPLYDALSHRAKGDAVEFSGTLLRSGPDFIKETSLTEAGSMEAPEFLIKLSAVN
jgi:hypothetical protein